MPSREEVYQAIDTEREYQDRIWGDTLSDDRPGDGSRSIDEFALYINGYAHVLMHTASHTGDPMSKLAVIRKITALGVACMEQHGAPRRTI